MNIKPVNFQAVADFEKRVAEFFGSSHGVATDSCTHAIELCLRYTKAKKVYVPKRTYLSIPMLADKLGIKRIWEDRDWQDYYFLTNDIADAAVLWQRGSYIGGTFMCVSFQFQKHLNLGRGGMILTDDDNAWLSLKKMSYDGRIPGIPWREQDIDTIGYHYYMTPETAELGLSKIDEAIATPPKKRVVTDWPDLTQMKIFKNG